MTNTPKDGSSSEAGPRPGELGTRPADGTSARSGLTPAPVGTTVRGSGGPNIPSGPGAFATKLTCGGAVAINGVSYTFERVISKSTGEAEIFLLHQDGVPCVFKLYYLNFKPKEEILALLKQLRHKDIINVIDYGYFHDRFFEIMEYAKGGTLEQYLPIRDLQRLRAIVSETVSAFEFCHARGIVHRDIKPQDIYCRNADGTDIAIGDFGISFLLDAGTSRRLTSQHLTAGYAAPEMYGFGGKVYIGREVDYYALGITLIHVWQGKNPFAGLTIHAIANLTTAGAINVPKDLPDTLQTLILGLLTIDFAKRWGHDEVQRWLNSEAAPVLPRIKENTDSPFLGIESATDEISELIGLGSAKSELRALISYIQIEKLRSERGGKEAPLNLHFVFRGGPGTGKTTVARILAKASKVLGLLPKGHLKEVDRSSLIGTYVGQTAPKVHAAIDESMGGVLFIDDAYMLKRGDSDSFGQEAINALLKRMEDDRGKFIVIAAGYHREMDEFLNSNSGLKSRFNKFIDFDDYEPVELTAIYLSLVSQKGMAIDPAAEALVARLFEELYANRDASFANGRTVRNIFRKTLLNQAQRIAPLVSTGKIETIVLDTIMAEDIPG